MASFRQFLLRIATLFRSGRAERDLDREIDSHLALLEDEFIAKGMAAADAKLAARRAFGGVDQTKERQRDARAFRWLADVPRDLSYALRSLRKNRAFTAAADHKVFSLVADAITNPESKATYENIMEHATAEALRHARDVHRSTSASSNIMHQETGRAWAELLDKVKWF